MKIICNEKHWNVVKGQLILSTPEGKEIVKSMVKVLERQIRVQIYNEICDVDLTADRKRVMKNGLENALLSVQDLLAKIALGESDA